MTGADRRNNHGNAKSSMFGKRKAGRKVQHNATASLHTDSDEEGFLHSPVENLTTEVTNMTVGSIYNNNNNNNNNKGLSGYREAMATNDSNNTMNLNNNMNSNLMGMGNMMNSSIPTPGEARIVAPHVSKLSPYSAVEVRLHSNSECVAILCSVDVLKMRSGFFHDILNDQEKALIAHGHSATNSHTHMMQSNLLWRDPIIIPDPSPFDAAAFLESLHEGRAAFKGEWSVSWSRLSVTWVVDELIQEYASQIEEHMNKIVSLIQNHHWRTNPTVLSGMRVAIFRKGNTPLPTVITG
jgi:hypothetical protein